VVVGSSGLGAPSLVGILLLASLAASGCASPCHSVTAETSGMAPGAWSQASSNASWILQRSWPGVHPPALDGIVPMGANLTMLDASLETPDGEVSFSLELRPPTDRIPGPPTRGHPDLPRVGIAGPQGRGIAVLQHDLAAWLGNLTGTAASPWEGTTHDIPFTVDHGRLSASWPLTVELNASALGPGQLRADGLGSARLPFRSASGIVSLAVRSTSNAAGFFSVDSLDQVSVMPAAMVDGDASAQDAATTAAMTVGWVYDPIDVRLTPRCTMT
jgi:hypothetical protein